MNAHCPSFMPQKSNREQQRHLSRPSGNPKHTSSYFNGRLVLELTTRPTTFPFLFRSKILTKEYNNPTFRIRLFPRDHSTQQDSATISISNQIQDCIRFTKKADRWRPTYSRREYRRAKLKCKKQSAVE